MAMLQEPITIEYVVVDDVFHRYKVVSNKLDAIRIKWRWANENYTKKHITNLPVIYTRQITHNQPVEDFDTVMTKVINTLFPYHWASTIPLQ